MTTHLVYKTQESRSSLGELDDVILLHSVEAYDDLVVREGARGTVLAVHADGEAYTVEFVEPVGALAIVKADGLRPIPEATRDRLAALAD